MPKYDVDTVIEGQILATLVRDKHFLGQFRRIIKPQYFNTAANIDVCRLIYQFHEKFHKPPAFATFVNYVLTWMKSVKRTKSEREAIHQTVEDIFHEEIEDPEYVKDAALQFAKQQEYIKRQEKGIALVQQGKVDEAVSLLSGVRMIGTDLSAPVDYFKETVQKEKGNWRRFQCGIKGFDRITGGIKARHYGVITAETNGYKTGTFVNVAKSYARNGYNILVIVNEQDEEEWQALLDCSILKMTHEQRYKANRKRSRLAKIRKTVGRLQKRWKGRIFIKYLPYGYGTVQDIGSYLELLQAQHGIHIDGVMVDSLDGLVCAQGGFGSYDNEKIVYKEFEALVGYYGIWGWTTCQVNIKDKDNKPVIITRLGQLRGFSDKVMLASVVVAVNMKSPGGNDSDEDDTSGFFNKSDVKKPRSGFMCCLKTRNTFVRQKASFIADTSTVGLICS